MQVSDMNYLCRCCRKMLQHINTQLTMVKIEIISYVEKVRS